MDSPPTAPVPPRPRVTNHEVQITDVTDLTSWYKRLTVDAQGLFEMYNPAPGAYLNLNLPSPQGTVQRSYSLRGVTNETFILEFVLHTPPGPGCQWAASAQPGMTVTVNEPPYSLVIPHVSQALLIADATAIPAVASIMERADPAMAMTVILADAHPDRERIALPQRENATLRWVDALRADDLRAARGSLDPQDCFLWAAGERDVAKTVREFTRGEFLVPRSSQHIQTYWIR